MVYTRLRRNKLDLTTSRLHCIYIQADNTFPSMTLPRLFARTDVPLKIGFYSIKRVLTFDMLPLLA